MRWIFGGVNMKHLIKVAMVVAFLSTPAVASGACDDGEIVIKFSHVTNTDKHPKGIAASLLEKRVNAEMNGTACMEVFPNSTLYNDNKVLEAMLQSDFNLGGEQSGHIILGKFATTGDGLLVALEALFAIRKGKKASSFFNKFKKTPQILENIHVKDKSIIKNSEVKESIKKAEKLMKGYGRILVRESGTESKIRVMGESENKELLDKCINIILRKIK